MRKLFICLIVASFLLMGAQAFADNELTDTKYLLVNTSDEKVGTLVPISLLIPGKCRVLKVTFSNIQADGDQGGVSSEVYGALYDCSSVGGANDKNVEGEIESDDAGSVAIDYGLRPLKIANGVVIVQGSNTAALVEWERILP